MALQDCSVVVFSLYDTMCYDYEHGASETCKATGCVFLARQISEYRYADRCQ